MAISPRIRVRGRPRDGLNPFLEGLRISPSEVRIDMLKIEFRGGIGAPSEDAYSRWWRALSRPRPDGDVIANLRHVGAAARFDVAPGMTVSGDGHIHRTPSGATFKLRLNANPTRTAQHIPYPSSPDFWQAAPPRLFFSEDLAASLEARGVSSNENDNILPTRLQGGYNPRDNPNCWPSFLAVFCQQITAFANAVFGATTGEEGAVVMIDPPSLKQSEFYVERWSADARADQRTLYDSARWIGAEAVRRVFLEDGGGPAVREDQRSGNDTSIAFTVGQNRRVKVYAKTPRRLRFEVQHHGRLPGAVTRRAHAQIDGRLHALLWEGTEDAAPRLNRLYAALWQARPLTRPTDGVGAVIELSARVRAAAMREDDVAPLLEQLLREGGLTQTSEAGFAPRSTIDALLTSHAIQHVGLALRENYGRGRRYVLTSEFAFLPQLLHPGLTVA